MYDTIYVETQVAEHPITAKIIRHFSNANLVYCERFGEIFNRRSQDFRFQKQHTSLILARKHEGYVLNAPDGYGVGGTKNYYFSVMLNCLYDCRYCFLQGMYRSAHHVVFVNFEDFAADIHKRLRDHGDDDEVWFFSGYDCDSLAMEPMFGFGEYFVDIAEREPKLWLELRTKSTQIRSLMAREPVDNVVVAFSFTPSQISESLEHRVPALSKRISAMVQLQRRGWKVGIRLDPLIFATDYQIQYSNLLEELFGEIDSKQLHSASVGVFRLPKAFYKNLEKLYPDDSFIAQPFIERNSQVSYPAAIEQEMKKWCYEKLTDYIDSEKIFLCSTEANL